MGLHRDCLEGKENMSYIRVDHKGNMRFVPEDNLLQSIYEDRGKILIVTGDILRSKQLWSGVMDYMEVSYFSFDGNYIYTQGRTINICTSFNWMNYCGLQLSSAYVHRDATLDFLLKIMSKCRLQPELFEKE